MKVVKTLCECIKSFSVLCETFYYQERTNLVTFSRKALITKAIYQLNKYNKGWLNTNLAEIPTLFTIDRVGQGFWVYSILGYLISGIQYFYVSPK